MRAVLLNADVARLTDTAYINELFSPSAALGPALLFYGSPSENVEESRVTGPLPLADPLVQSVLSTATDAERDESGIDDCTSGLYVVLEANDGPAAIAGWRDWPCRIAHMSVLTASTYRSQGHGCTASAHALREATSAGLLPQWRAAHSNDASIGLARRLGLVEIGEQYSIRVT
jgi:GNAT acetyltransferase